MVRLEAEREFARIYDVLQYNGKLTSPRGAKTLEVENFTYTLAPYVRFNPFLVRNLNINYIKRELAWYIKADNTDMSIVEYAKAWGPMVKDGILNSCYGTYWFKNKTGVHDVLLMLTQDPDSRRAVIPMYGTDPAHHDKDVRDVPCTTSVEFRIRNGRLNARFVMRSQDAVLGMGNDVPAFSFLQEVVARLLGIELGWLTVSVGSFHVYERHFEMVNAMSSQNADAREFAPMPLLTLHDALCISHCQIPITSAFAQWLLVAPEAPVKSD